MRYFAWTGSIFVLLLSVMIARADPPAGEDQQNVEDRVMPDIKIADQSLESVLSQIKEKMPAFHYVIFRNPGQSRDFPKLPAMTLGTIRIKQFFELIQNEYPGVRFTSIYDPVSGPVVEPLYQIEIKPAPTTLPDDAPKTVVRVFGLSEIIAYRASLITDKSEAEARKQASDDVLSLMQAALNLSDASVKPELKMHPPTQALICKGTEEQGKVIEDVVAALRPGEMQQKDLAQRRKAHEIELLVVEKQREMMQSEIENVQLQLEELVGKYGAASPQVKQLEQKLRDLQKAAATLPSTQPSK